MAPKKSPGRKAKSSKEPTPEPTTTTTTGTKDDDTGDTPPPNHNNKKRKSEKAKESLEAEEYKKQNQQQQKPSSSTAAAVPEGKKKKTAEELQDEIANLETEAFDSRSKLLSKSQFGELLGLQSDDEPGFIEELVEMYTDDARSMLNELVELFREKDAEVNFDRVRGTLHKLKGTSSTFGADGVTELCDQMRELCIKKNVKDLRMGPQSLVELEKRVEKLAGFLGRYMAKLKELAVAKAESN